MPLNPAHCAFDAGIRLPDIFVFDDGHRVKQVSIMATEASCVMLVVLSSKQKKKKNGCGCTPGWHREESMGNNKLFLCFPPLLHPHGYLTALQREHLIGECWEMSHSGWSRQNF